jgi:hypothetical protein
MNLPRRYSYDPRWKLVVLLLGAGGAWMGVQELLCGCRPRGFNLVFGLTTVAVGFLLTVRRLAFKRYLVLGTDILLLPTGFAGMRTTQIPYTSIKRVWRAYAGYAAVLCVATKQGNFQVVAAMLPESGSFTDVEDFLKSRAQDSPKVSDLADYNRSHL